MQDAIRKSEVLIEALPYIKKFFRKNIVIKFGGNSIADDNIRKSVLKDIVFMNFAGMNPVLIHGGGPFINSKLKEAGKKSRFVDGLRVTDRKTMTIVDEALTLLNRQLVSEIKEIGAEAFGLSGKENNLLVANKAECATDVGYTGTVCSLDTTVLMKLIEANMIPVISPVAIGEDGLLYNVNADEAASRIAVSIKGEKLILLTNVPGVKCDSGDESTIFRSLSLSDTQYLIDKKIIAGGMIPKAKACLDALEGRVKKAHIVDAGIPHAILLEIFTDRGIGTEIMKLGKRTKATESI